MARSKNFITKKLLNTIIQKYGGGHRWEHSETLSHRTAIWYSGKNGTTLTVNQLWEGKEFQFPYIMVHISDGKGVIYRKDRYDFTDTDHKNISFVYTEENGHFYDTFRKVGESMARQTKEARIKELEKRNKDLSELLEQVTKRNSDMAQQAEDSFLNSPTHHQMQEEISFYKSLNKLNDSHVASLNQRIIGWSEDVKQIYADNQAMCEKQADTDYFIGITENWHEAREYMKLKEEITRLNGIIEQQKISIADRDKEIERLQGVVGELKQAATTPPSETEEIKELKKEIEELQEDSENCIKYYNEIRKLESDLSREKTLHNTTKRKLADTRSELKKEQTKRYDLYVPEDEKTYNEMLQHSHTQDTWIKTQQQLIESYEKELEQLREQVSSLPTQQAVEIIEQNIETSSKVKPSKKSGRPPKIDNDRTAIVMELKDKGYSMRAIATQLNVSVGTIHRIIHIAESKGTGE